ncbi:MAG: PilZ domain-containing protein [Phycisphaerae bacterium]|nr:PilZ domain-containing protein [Phycisphaerae bacterium]
MNALFGRFAVSPQTATEPGARFPLTNCTGALWQGEGDEQAVSPISLLDISRTGLGFSIDRPLAPGERAWISFDVMEQPGERWAIEVVWCRRSALGDFHVGAVVSASRSVRPS